MSAPACTRARSRMAQRARPPLRLGRSPNTARTAWRSADPGALHHRARLLPPCGAD